ncbi:hypothetical protein GCM10027276_07890 [Comamonas piscis]
MQLLHIDNYTLFEWFAFEKMAPRRALHDVVVVKASLPMSDRWDKLSCRPEDAHACAIEMAERTRQSELGVYAPLSAVGDTVIFKPYTDVYITGHARPHEPLREWGAQITIRTAKANTQQRWLLQGARHWQHGAFKGWHLSRPSVVEESIPLIYELAYGGSYPKKDEWVHHAVNPVGRGFIPYKKLDLDVHYPAVQIELYPQRLKHIDQPIPVPALGPISRVWDLRSQYAGTYDRAWHGQPDHPLGKDYPHDFDNRFFQAAPPAWIFPHFTGDEQIEILGLTGEHPAIARTPVWQPALTVASALQAAPTLMPMVLDTVELDIDALQTRLTWRASIPHTAEAKNARIDIWHRPTSKAPAKGSSRHGS